MPEVTTYTKLRGDLANILDRVDEKQEPVIVRRRGPKDVALIPAAELSGLMETAHLLRSPKNAARLISALKSAEKGRGRRQTVKESRREFGLERLR
jgi:antitoxin YefM